MLGGESVFVTDAERAINRHRVVRGPPLLEADSDVANDGEVVSDDVNGDDDGASDADGDSGGPAAAAAAAENGLPPGYTVVSREAPSGRKYKMYTAPGGTRLGSRAAAWAHFSSAQAASSSRPMPDESPEPQPTVARSTSTRNTRAGSFSFPDDLSQHVVHFERPSTRPPPRQRS